MGYIGKKFSERAYDAYCENIKPYSQFSKDDILEHYSRQFIKDLNLEKYSLNVLKKVFLEYDSWHHVGSYYNEIDFYKLSDENDILEENSIQEIKDYLNLIKEELKKERLESKKEKTNKPLEKVYFEYEEDITNGYGRWRNWKEYHAYGIKKGNWIYTLNGKKKADGKHIFEIKVLNRAPAGTADEFKKIRKLVK